MESKEFQSTHPRGVRPVDDAEKFAKWMISIHAPTWGATQPVVQLLCDIIISIHAPTWGATPGYRGVIAKCVLISIHAPTWGATKETFEKEYESLYFNPRTHVGCDEQSELFTPRYVISIHAPTWGATSCLPPFHLHLTFQSTHPRGVRPITGYKVPHFAVFQSTHPRGVRQAGHYRLEF